MATGREGLLLQEQSSRDVKQTIHLHVVTRKRMVELYLHSPIYLYGMAFNELSTGNILTLAYKNKHILYLGLL
jgi:hypothetical protein